MFEVITIDELLKRLDKYNHKELHVHHTWKPSHKDFNGSNGVKLQQSMRDYHVNTLKWNDIGQHVTLLLDGTFVTGRDFAKTPASISGYNTGAFACEMLGNFDSGNDVLKGAQKESIIKLARYFYDKGRYIRFHRENAPKTCPGTSIDKNAFMNEVKNLNVNQINVKEEVKVKNLVVYGNSIDKRAAEYLADYLGCATLDGNIAYDYSNVENVYCVGGAPSLPWTSYAKKIITGKDRYDTIIQVLKFIGRV
ncbi:N-acetylmuramoyl-L-alanine amidase [Clostridium sp. SYSU_GA19001]|uniref:N-acetylmuramoyl-L-alanine amidase n=1 Tax=Clostridium caldaquaticum TaxID=2940653 RepID=UPI002076F54B|nr:N-acetylmuramoyl-L-alanine amidase [Clostridium caldaquaticum]MCM8710553.1 N-acetylmuramoyl-L-alanine amidase [Clostridium caldaquaticum]